MDLKELRYFRAIADAGTLCKAAAHLRIAQPALTRQVQKLEHDLGVQLLIRNSRGITLTPAGTALLERTLRLEHDLEDIRRSVMEYAERVSGKLHVAVQYPLSVLMMPDLVVRYRGSYPAVALHVVEKVSRSITDGLLREELDVAIVDAPSHEHADLTTLPLWIENLRLVGPATAAFSPLFRRGHATIEDIAKLPMIMPTQHHAVRRLIDVGFAKRHLHFEPSLEIDGAALIREMVKRGIGYTLMPLCAFHAMQEAGELISIDVRPALRRVVSLVTRTALLYDAKTRALIEMVRQSAPGLAANAAFGPAMLCCDGTDWDRASSALDEVA